MDTIGDSYEVLEGTEVHDKLLEKGNTFKWTPERETSFQVLKKRLTTAPILTMPDLSRLQYIVMHQVKELDVC